MTLYVERLTSTLRSEDPGTDTAAAIEAGGTKGWTLISILPLNNEIQLVWDKPDTEQR